MTLSAFESSMSRLAGLRFAPATMSTHYEALADLAPSELEAAIDRCARECDEFPSPKMIRAFVDEARGRVEVPEEDQTRARVLRMPKRFELPDGTEIKITRTWSYYCETCSDTGVRSFWCGDRGPRDRFPWMASGVCGRRRAHAPHEWTEKCPCAETNPDVLRKKAQAQQVIRKEANR